MVKIITRIGLGILAIILVFIIFLFGSIAVDAIVGRDRLDKITNLTISSQDGAHEVHAYLAKPEGEGPFPTVIMIHEFFGLNDSIVGKAEGLAQEGYVVIAPDTFRGSTTSWIPRAIYQVITTAPEQINQDLDAVYAWLETQPEVHKERIAVVGFCYGGRASLAYSLHNSRLAATAIFYGSPETDPQVLRSLPGPVLGIFGEADNSIPVKKVQEFESALNQAGVSHEITIYPGQPHAFVTDIEAIRAGGVQGQAWAQMIQFLDKNLKGESTSIRSVEATHYTTFMDLHYYLVLAYEHAFGAIFRTDNHIH